jgi:hypothetical protein
MGGAPSVVKYSKAQRGGIDGITPFIYTPTSSSSSASSLSPSQWLSMGVLLSDGQSHIPGSGSSSRTNGTPTVTPLSLVVPSNDSYPYGSDRFLLSSGTQCTHPRYGENNEGINNGEWRVAIIECIIPRPHPSMPLPVIIRPTGTGGLPSKELLDERERAQLWFPTPAQQPQVTLRTLIAGARYDIHRGIDPVPITFYDRDMIYNQETKSHDEIPHVSELLLTGPLLTMSTVINKAAEVDNRSLRAGSCIPINHYNLYWIHPLTLVPTPLFHHLSPTFTILRRHCLITGWLLICIINDIPVRDEFLQRHQHEINRTKWKTRSYDWNDYPHYNYKPPRPHINDYIFLFVHHQTVRLCVQIYSYHVHTTARK